LGEDTVAVLNEWLGLAAGEIAQLTQAGTVT
jgi:crotonobetainyl-CoA:carnitine CoA-transferase CaiB-like acyl-CoA transferase